MHHPLDIVIFIRPPALVHGGKIRLIRVSQRTQHIIQKHVLIQHILYIVQIIVVIEIGRKRVFRLLHATRIGRHIDPQENRLHLMTAVKDNIHAIRLILRVGAAVAKFDRLKSHQFLKPVGVKIHRHGGSKDHTVVFHVLRHSRILGELVVHQIGKVRKRRMVLEKRIYPDHQRGRQYKPYESEEHDGENPYFKPLHAITILKN